MEVSPNSGTNTDPPKVIVLSMGTLKVVPRLFWETLNAKPKTTRNIPIIPSKVPLFWQTPRSVSTTSPNAVGCGLGMSCLQFVFFFVRNLFKTSSADASASDSESLLVRPPRNILSGVFQGSQVILYIWRVVKTAGGLSEFWSSILFVLFFCVSFLIGTIMK